jgi:hypothetical protein
MLKNILPALFEDAKVLALVLGIILIVLAGTNAISFSAFRLELAGAGGTRIVTLGVGTFLILLSSISIFVRSFYTPLSHSIAAHRVGLKITFPVDEQSIHGHFHVKGKCKRPPKGKDVRAFVASTHEEKVWPQGPVVFDAKNKTWDCMIHLWESPKPDAYIFIAELGENGAILCDYYGTVGFKFGIWIPLKQLTSDTIEYDRVRVVNSCPP